MLAGPGQIAERLQALAQGALAQDVVGRGLQDGLELAARGRQLAAVEQRPPQGQPQGGIGREALDALAARAHGLGQVAVLAQLVHELGVEPCVRLLLEPSAQLLHRGERGAAPGTVVRRDARRHVYTIRNARDYAFLSPRG